MEQFDCVLIHHSGPGPNAKHIAPNVSMGVFALADILQRNGYRTEIIHLGIEEYLDNSFSLARYLRVKKPLLVGVTLHWHLQCSKTVGLVRSIKKIVPGVKVILGGYTASFFADQIMPEVKEVDFIIRGDAEKPLLELMRQLKDGHFDLSSVPNLTWRRAKKVIHNKQSYVAKKEDLDQLNFSNFKLMKNSQFYLGSLAKIYQSVQDTETYNLLKLNPFYLSVGRGCRFNCLFCGGSAMAQKLINNRNNLVFRSSKKVISTIKDAFREGVDTFCICFDPNLDKSYYFDLFQSIRKNRIKISMMFDCWSLPSFEFIDAFAKTFQDGKHSSLALSPETGSERLRKKYKGSFHTNQEYFEVFRYLRAKGIKCVVQFGYIFPGESMVDFKKTSDFIETTNEIFKGRVLVIINKCVIDPASLFYMFPKKYKITRKAVSFSDYCRLDPWKSYSFFPAQQKKMKAVLKMWQKVEALQLLDIADPI
ncbi:MAG: radical SAM protein [Candidatus Omnitrophica bacterium]|nr:radical SAM protein [Candidatus Omnitrophota bacterium]